MLCIESAKTVNKMTLNELVRLMTLWKNWAQFALLDADPLLKMVIHSLSRFRLSRVTVYLEVKIWSLL